MKVLSLIQNEEKYSDRWLYIQYELFTNLFIYLSKIFCNILVRRSGLKRFKGFR